MVVILVKSKPVLKCAAYVMALCLGQPAAVGQAVQSALAPPPPYVSRNTDGRGLFFDKNYADMLGDAVTQADPAPEKTEPASEKTEPASEKAEPAPEKTEPESEKTEPVQAEEYRETTMFSSVRLNLREGPGLEAGIIKVLNPNEEVAVLESRDGWCHVRLGTEQGEEGGEEPEFGYVKEEYLSDEKLTAVQLNRWGIELTPEEIDLLAKILWVEARGEPFEGQAAVVEVVFNRMISTCSDLPEEDLTGILSSTRCGVQFASWALRDTADPGEDLYQVIYQVLNGSVTVLPSTEYVFFSTQGMGKNIIQIGNHRFGTL